MTGTDVIIVVVDKVSSRLMMDWSTFVASKNCLSSENEQQKPSELDGTSSVDDNPMTAYDHIYNYTYSGPLDEQEGSNQTVEWVD